MNKLFKSILSLAVISFMLGGVSYAYNEPTINSYMLKRAVGGRQDDRTIVLKLVRFTSESPNGPDIASGDAVVWDILSDDGVSVRLTTTSNDSAFAGIAVTAIQTSDRSASNPPASAFDDLNRRNWGYIAVSGVVTAKVAAGQSGGVSAGDLFITSSDSGAVGILQPCQGAVVAACVNQAANGAANSGGIFLDAGTASGTSIKVNVRRE